MVNLGASHTKKHCVAGCTVYKWPVVCRSSVLGKYYVSGRMCTQSTVSHWALIHRIVCIFCYQLSVCHQASLIRRGNDFVHSHSSVAILGLGSTDCWPLGTLSKWIKDDSHSFHGARHSKVMHEANTCNFVIMQLRRNEIGKANENIWYKLWYDKKSLACSSCLILEFDNHEQSQATYHHSCFAHTLSEVAANIRSILVRQPNSLVV